MCEVDGPGNLNLISHILGNFPYTYTEEKKNGETKTQPGRHLNACQAYLQTAEDLVKCLQKRNGVQYIAKTKLFLFCFKKGINLRVSETFYVF